ncbi:hypothetical protein EYC80_008165 [Monilinia laxa]|uniref:Uncharacterized protein n=1 Tax=Monilinia laxa TaxID=61186 RepID=A0A5N6JVN7_MONLA|nr:hypothetical protein EYC80_008165 [Monilinia laxa]
MKLSSAFLLTVLTFFNLNTAMVIPNDGPEAIAAVAGPFSTETPQTTIDHQPKFPFNTTELELSSPFVVLSSLPSSNTEADKTINPSNVHDKRFFGYSTSYNINRKIKPYCPSLKKEYRTCATQKEVDQGWHDTDGCYRVPALRFLGALKLGIKDSTIYIIPSLILGYLSILHNYLQETKLFSFNLPSIISRHQVQIDMIPM